MNSYEFMSQHPESFNAVFEGLYAYLKRVGINVNGKVYVGKFAHNDRLAWLLLNKDDDPMMYTEYNADKNELNCRRINILEIDYKIPEPKSDPVDSFQHVNWSGLFRQMDEIKDKSTDAPNKISEHFRTLHESKSKPEQKCKPFPFMERKEAEASAKSMNDWMDECMKKFKESHTVPRMTWDDVFKELMESKPQPTLKSIINSSMDEIMSELASMKHAGRQNMDKIERVYKAAMNEFKKND